MLFQVGHERWVLEQIASWARCLVEKPFVIHLPPNIVPKQILAAVLMLWAAAGLFAQTTKPNIVLILADDLGYGDVSCYGAARVQTPNVDRLAGEGLRFTDAHSAAATCTPSRYALLTGEYAWRKKGTNVLPGNAPLIIELGRTTLASMLQKAGYVTAVVGKWHLGLGVGNPDWNGDIRPGPLEIGFQYCFLIPATGDRTPCVYVENHRVVGLDPRDPIQVSYERPIGNDPTGREHPERDTSSEEINTSLTSKLALRNMPHHRFPPLSIRPIIFGNSANAATPPASSARR